MVHPHLDVVAGWQNHALHQRSTALPLGGDGLGTKFSKLFLGHSAIPGHVCFVTPSVVVLPSGPLGIVHRFSFHLGVYH